MIKNRQDLKEYLEADRIQLGVRIKQPRPFVDDVWKFEIVLRYYEYWLNQSGFFAKFMTFIYKFRWHKMQFKYGIGIGPNCVGKGLSIAHINGININDKAIVGDNLRIQECVTVGASGGDKAPRIGNNVFLASGCKVMGDVYIADDCVVGANAVVVHDVLEPGITVAGVPAKKISNKDSSPFVFWYKGGIK